MTFFLPRRRLMPSGVCLPVLLGIFSFSTTLPAQQLTPTADIFARDVVPFLTQHCTDCHNEFDANAGLEFDQFTTEPQAFAKQEVWLHVLDALDSGIMPPDEMPQPKLEDIAKVKDWIENVLLVRQCEDPPPSPEIVLRRLNREEYNNTIRDLFGVDLRPADSFPADDIAFGFDNVGASLNLSPSHIEKYLEAAEWTMDRVISVPSADDRSPVELVGLRTVPVTDGKAVAITPEDPVTFQSGRHLVEVTLTGLFDRNRLPQLTVQAGRDSRRVEPVIVESEFLIYRVWLTLDDGDNPVHLTLHQDPLDPNDENVDLSIPAFRTDLNQTGLAAESVILRGPCDRPTDQLTESQSRLLCSLPSPDGPSREDAAREVVNQFLPRAWRRPPTEAEVERLLSIFELADARGESFERAIQVVGTYALIAPPFLYLVEPEESSGDRPLTDDELASRLSYFLWSSMPDDELRQAAAEGTLRGNLNTHVQRMLTDPKAEALVTNFAGQWLQLRRLEGVNPDRELFPEFDDELRESMRRETELFFATIVREDRSILELLDADYTYVNQRLAEHYGLDEVQGQDFQRVQLADRSRGGVLTHASILTLTSNPNRTSPVKRGEWILQQLLASPPPPPPPDVPELDDSATASKAGSLRERLQLHRASAECASCHERMDPLGFALENYNAIGRWRELDGEFPIDPSGVLTDGREFDDAGELRRLLTDKPKKYCQSFIENMLTYALGRGPVPFDICTTEEIRKDLEENDYRFSRVIVGIVNSPAFQHRGETKSP